ncbi:MAG: response regulator transcription factor, partial [Saprospiraceae bacterium]|nr:response regulator transcription factor [Saprospiraceae bacterium]
IYEEQPDIVILDLELKGEKSGLDIAREITHLQIPIIFTTSYKDKATFEQTKQFYCFGYLVKPFNKISLQSVLEQTIKTLFPEGELNEPSAVEAPNLPNTVLVKHVNMLFPVKLDSILFIQGEGNYCSIHTVQRKFMLKTSLKRLLDSLPATEFSAVHKSFIIRLDKVESIDVSSGKLVVGKETLPLGRNFKTAFLSRFSQLK